MKPLTYKGFVGNISLDKEEGLLFGKLADTTDLVTFESEKASEIVQAFQEAVDDYLTLCDEIGKDPIRPFTGTFNVRIKKKLHKKAVFSAHVKGVSLNQFVQESIELNLQ